MQSKCMLRVVDDGIGRPYNIVTDTFVGLKKIKL